MGGGGTLCSCRLSGKVCQWQGLAPMRLCLREVGSPSLSLRSERVVVGLEDAGALMLGLGNRLPCSSLLPTSQTMLHCWLEETKWQGLKQELHHLRSMKAWGWRWPGTWSKEMSSGLGYTITLQGVVSRVWNAT